MRKKYKKPPLIETLCEFYFAPETSQDFDNIINLLYEKIQPARTAGLFGYTKKPCCSLANTGKNASVSAILRGRTKEIRVCCCYRQTTSPSRLSRVGLQDD